MEDKEMNEMNEEMELPEDGGQADFEAEPAPAAEEFQQDLGERFESVGAKIEEKVESFGDEMERVGQKISAAFEEAFGEEDMDNVDEVVHVTVDKSGKTVDNRGRGGGQAIFWGLAMIAVGAGVILSQLGILNTGFNWWAVFILVPGLGLLSGALDLLLAKRRISSGVLSMVGSGLLILTIGTMLLFALNWSVYWPLVLLAVGFSLFLNGFAGKKDYKSVTNRWFTRFGWWTGLAVMGLGAAFLLKNLDIFSLRVWYGEFAQAFTAVSDGWWGLFLLLPGVGGLLHSLIIILSTKRFPFAAILLAVAGISCLSVGLVAALGLKWSLILPLLVIGAGVVIVLGELLHQVVKDRKVHRVRGENEVEGKVVE